MDTSFFKNEWFKTVSAVLLGGAANEFSHYLADRRERKKAIARALADLLEVRLRFVSTDMVIRELGKLIALTALDQAQVRDVFNAVVGGWPQLVQRYNESVKVVASVAPILAFQLRSKEIGQQILQMADVAMASIPQSTGNVSFHEVWQKQLTPLLSKGVTQALTRTCRRVAWKHGAVSWLKVHLMFRRGIQWTAEEQQFL